MSEMEEEFRLKIPSPTTLCSFITLAVIRGSFALTVHYGIAAYKAPSLLFLLRTPGTVVLFLISMLLLSSREEEVKAEIVNDLSNPRSYKRAALLGFLQLCGPYLLFMYALKYFSPTLGGVFMASTPWATALLEQIFVLTGQVVDGPDWNTIGSVTGAVGMVLVSIANICMITTDTSCEAKCGYHNVTHNITNGSSFILNVSTEQVVLQEDTCFTSVEITTGFLALCGASLLWSVSAVFSRHKRISLHFLTGGLMNNLFAGLYAAILWVVIDQHISTGDVVWSSFSGSFSVIFLTFASSWLAALVLYHLFRKIGAESTNRVMCLVPLITWFEDFLFLKHHTHLWIVVLEAIGVLLVIAGLYICSFRKGQSRLRDAPLLPDYVSEEENDDGSEQQRVTELTQSVQSDEGLQESGTSSMQDSVDPPMIHYADDHDQEDEGHMY